MDVLYGSLLLTHLDRQAGRQTEM